jgi:hypothetical protein
MSSTSALGFLLVMTFPLLGGNDLLDLKTPEEYWKSKGVTMSVDAMLGELKPKEKVDISVLIKQLGADQFREREAAMKAIREVGPPAIEQLQKAADGADAEIADRAKTLLKQLGVGELATAERKLMAIRALGDLKQREALAELKKLRASKEPFVAEHAEEAIAKIEGKSYTRPKPTQKERDEDLYLLDERCFFVLQAGLTEHVPIDWNQIVKHLRILPNGVERDATIAKYEKAFKTLLERAGNIRIDLVTVGLQGNLLGGSGYGMVVFRGQYHALGFIEEAKKLGLEHGKAESWDGFDVIMHPANRNTAVILVSNDRLVLVSGIESLDLATPTSSLRRGRGTFEKNAKFVEFVKKIDRSKPIWAATMPNESHLGLLGIEGLASMRLEVSQAKDGLDAVCQIEASNFESVKSKLGEAMKARDTFLPAIRGSLVTYPQYKPLVDFAESLKLTDDGKIFTITGNIPNTASLLLLPVVEGRSAVE